MFTYDAYGFFSGEVETSASNATDIKPPECKAGETPRFVNGSWVCEVKDFAAIIASEQAQIADSLASQRETEIKARLAEIDKLGDSPRARREALLGQLEWITQLDTEAAALRAELEGL